MSGRPKVNKAHVFARWAQGWTMQRIADECGVSRTTIWYCLNRPTSRTNKVREDRCTCDACVTGVHPAHVIQISIPASPVGQYGQ